jgi:drug/metabolite transporter (DMT)-like permease
VTAITLALVSALAWGTSDFIGGTQSRRVAVPAILLVSYGVGAVVLVAFVAASGDAWPGLGSAWPALAGGAAGIAGLACLYRGLAIGTMSIVAPISGLSAALPVVVGVATGDALTALQAAGIAAATVGVVLASLERHADPIRARDARLGVLFGLAAALGIGCFYVGADAAADTSAWWALLASRMGGLALILAAVAVRRPAIPRTPAGLAPLLAIAALDTVANTLYVVSSTLGLLSVVSVISALYPVTTVLLAMALLHERLRPVQAAGVVAAFAGVALIAAG